MYREEIDKTHLSGGLFTVYQAIAKSTAIYAEAIDKDFDLLWKHIEQENTKEIQELFYIIKRKIKLAYVSLGLAGEAGEIANKVKKILRGDYLMDDKLIQDLSKEAGDCQWYLSNFCEEIERYLSDVADENLEKLLDRKSRNTLQGTGDNR
jgi:NTP pyrophosphatase (non-canonical NTP hydrolase)